MFWNQTITLEIYLYFIIWSTLFAYVTLKDLLKQEKSTVKGGLCSLIHMEIQFLKKGIFFSSVMSISKNNSEVAGSGESLDSNRIHCQRGLTRCEFDFVFQKRESVAISLRVWHSLVQLLIKSPLAIVWLQENFGSGLKFVFSACLKGRRLENRSCNS